MNNGSTTCEHRTFWSKIADRYDPVVELQIGEGTRAMVRERLLQEQRLGDVVEFGCGTGFFTGVLATKAAAVLATDLAPGMLAVAEQRTNAANVRFQEDDCQKSSSPDSTFDTAFMSLVIHFTDAAKTLAEMHRILKPGGSLIIANADPGVLNRWNRLRWLARGIYYGVTRHRTKPPADFAKNLITERQLCDLLIKNGFEIRSTEMFRNLDCSSHLPIEYIKAVKI